ncbi:hypothetical protein O1611_g5761 [Lasiodiplodia mahajangana]|uniref:Uncharacterized protein n=1 Tax=Lasiodiplodia mahajangana TaxID=1108764 RepID=A0ACC2JKG9_9PEZI|nr:hypothetical protein O1611_g5761 [Lasiodiplodia mahajangana]
MATANTTTTPEVQGTSGSARLVLPEECSISPSRRTFTIGAQNIGAGAKVHNGDNFYLARRASTFDRRRPAIVKWLSPLNFDGIHERIHYEASVADQSELSRDEQYAGKWLLESDQFDAWRTGEMRKLWYFGMPGAGKTVLASIIIEHLRELQSNLKRTTESPMIAFLYLSYKNIHTIEQLLGSVIRQLVQNEEPLPQPVTKLWARRNQGDDAATVKDLTELLKAVVQGRQGYIVIDALDECSPDYRLRLIKALEVESENLSLLVTSRLLDEISKGFENIPIRANSSDLDLFIDHEIETRSRLKRFSEQDRTLRSEIKDAVRKACDGIFDAVIAQSCITYMSLTVLEQPDDEENQMSYADDIYHVPDDRSAVEVLRAYQSSGPSTERLSFENKRNVFPFVDYATPHLRYHLNQIEAGSEISSNFVPSLARLLQDRSKRNYFLRMLGEHGLPRPYSHHHLAKLALGSNLSSSANEKDDASETEEDEEVDDGKSAWEDRADTLIEMILDDSNFDTDAESETDYDSDFTPSGSSSRRVNHGKFTALHLAAFLGWPPIIHTLLGLPEELKNVNTEDPWGRTPITIAANEGNWDVVPVLLSHGASVDTLSAEYCYILLHAAQTGRKDVFETLISQARGPLTLKPSDVAFMMAVMSAASDFIIFLFLFFKAVFSAWDQKPVPNLNRVSGTQDKEPRPTADGLGNHLQLVEASMLGNVETINDLIQDAKINFKNQHSVFHLMALFSAVEFDQPAAVQSLLGAGADVDMLDFGGSTPLHRAVSRNHVSVVKTLLAAKPNVEIRNDDGQTPWSSSLDREHREGNVPAPLSY